MADTDQSELGDVPTLGLEITRQASPQSGVPVGVIGSSADGDRTPEASILPGKICALVGCASSRWLTAVAIASAIARVNTRAISWALTEGVRCRSIGVFIEFDIRPLLF